MRIQIIVQGEKYNVVMSGGDPMVPGCIIYVAVHENGGEYRVFDQSEIEKIEHVYTTT